MYTQYISYIYIYMYTYTSACLFVIVYVTIKSWETLHFPGSNCLLEWNGLTQHPSKASPGSTHELDKTQANIK